MADRQAQAFIDALHALEERGDAEALVALFADGAELQNPTHHEPYRGRQGAADFWHGYRRSFGAIHSEFRNVVAADGVVMLEWTSRGRLANGAEVAYDGVSVVEYEDGAVRRFRAYFDPTALGHLVAPSRG